VSSSASRRSSRTMASKASQDRAAAPVPPYTMRWSGSSATSGSRLFISIRGAASCGQPRQDSSVPRGARTVRGPAVASVLVIDRWYARRRTAASPGSGREPAAGGGQGPDDERVGDQDHEAYDDASAGPRVAAPDDTKQSEQSDDHRHHDARDACPSSAAEHVGPRNDVEDSYGQQDQGEDDEDPGDRSGHAGKRRGLRIDL